MRAGEEMSPVWRQGGGSLATVSAGYTWHWVEFELADELVDVVDGRGMRVWLKQSGT